MKDIRGRFLPKLTHAGFFFLAARIGTFCTAVLAQVPPAVPTITSQPTNQTVRCDSTNVVTFEVVADGVPPLSYLWLANGQRLGIPATNATLELTHVHFESGTKFTVVVTSAFGAVVSDPATLTVTDTPAPK